MCSADRMGKKPLYSSKRSSQRSELRMSRWVI